MVGWQSLSLRGMKRWLISENVHFREQVLELPHHVRFSGEFIPEHLTQAESSLEFTLRPRNEFNVAAVPQLHCTLLYDGESRLVAWKCQKLYMGL